MTARPKPTAPYVHVEGLGKGFAGDGSGPLAWVFRGLSLQAAAGETIHLCGPSGAGKSTVLNLLAGLLRPDEGTVRVGSLLVSALGESARDHFRAHHVGYIYQTFNLLAALSVRENLLVPQGLMGHPIGRGSARFAAAEAFLERLGLAAHARKRPAALSVGQRQRVAVARALIHSPQLVLADEPTASLDEETAAVVAAVLGEQTARGAVLVYASHDPVLVSRLGGRPVALSSHAAVSAPGDPQSTLGKGGG